MDEQVQVVAPWGLAGQLRVVATARGNGVVWVGDRATACPRQRLVKVVREAPAPRHDALRAAIREQGVRHRAALPVLLLPLGRLLGDRRLAGGVAGRAEGRLPLQRLALGQPRLPGGHRRALHRPLPATAYAARIDDANAITIIDWSRTTRRCSCAASRFATATSYW